MGRKLNTRPFAALLCLVAYVALSTATMAVQVPAFDSFSYDVSGQPVYSPGGPGLYYTVGRDTPSTTQNPTPDYQIAVPFIATATGSIKSIDLAYVHSSEDPQGSSPGIYAFIYGDRMDETGTMYLGEPPINIYCPQDDCTTLFSSYVVPTCDLDCLPLTPPLPLYQQDYCVQVDENPCNLSASPTLAAGQRYWLIVTHTEPSSQGFANFARWYCNDQSLAPSFSSIRRRGVPGTDGLAANGPWDSVANGIMPAFRIIVDSAECPAPSVPVGSSCALEQSPTGTDSNCWWAAGSGFTNLPDHGRGIGDGFPLNINLWQGFGPSDYPPPTLDPVSSSIPLVSKDIAHFAGPSPFQSRPMHNEIIDIVTGQPLVQAIDFELPFGGAVFRHVRTYSENASQMTLVGGTSSIAADRQPADGTFWDWNGQFWMMSENPILLIDAKYQDMTAGPIVTPDAKRCYLIPDAHHAIPFLYDPNTSPPSYVAPSWFDAQLEYSSAPNTDSQGRPLFYYAWLNRKSIKYTFRANYDDIWIRTNGHSAHEPPTPLNQLHEDTGGLGIPHYGLLTQIEDRYGNRIELNYCNFQQSDPSSPVVVPGGCKRCSQNCVEKGQLNNIKLYTKDPQSQQDHVVWTLVYTHRAFPTLTAPFVHYGPGSLIIPPQFKDSFQQHALHSINVYKGDVTDLPSQGLTLPSDLFCDSANSIDIIDGLQHDWVRDHPAWVMESKYLYSEEGYVGGFSNAPNGPPLLENLCPSAALFGDASAATDNLNSNFRFRNGKRLLKTTVTRKSETGAIDKKWTLYREGPTVNFPDANRNNLVALKYIYESPTVDAIVKARRIEVGDPTAGPNFLFERATTDDYPWPTTGPGQNDPALRKQVKIQLSGTDTLTSVDLASLADIEMKDYAEGVTQRAGLREALVSGYIHGDLARTGPNMVTRRCELIDRRASQQHTGHYHYYYYVQYPDGLIDQGSNFDPDSLLPRITYHFPFQFKHPMGTYVTDISFHQAPLDSPFFITVIDEQGNGNYEPTIPSGLRTRRVVQMNPAGFVLKDETWNFETGQQSSSGLTEEYKRDSRGRLIQRRTLGWAAANAQSQGQSQGLIYEYKYEDDECGQLGSNPPILSIPGPNGTILGLFNCRPGELIAEGIRKGTEGQLFFTKKYERHQQRPELVTKSVQFPIASTTPNETLGEVTTTKFVFDSSVAIDHAPIREKTVVRPPAPVTRGGSLTYPVEKSHYDGVGNLDWHGMGQLSGADPDSNPVYFIMETAQRDDRGRLLEQITDVPSNYGTAPPSGWARISQSSALDLRSTYSYDDMYGVNKIVHPNVRQTRIAVLPVAEGIEQWTFSNLQIDGGNYVALSPVHITLTSGGRTIWDKTARVNSIDGEPDGVGEDVQLISTATPEYDSNGRVVGSSQAGTDNSTVSSGITYDGFGNIGRLEEPDGTITRNVYDSRGRLERVYRGTNDQHSYWGTAAPCPDGQPSDPPNCYAYDGFPDNLVLVEKNYFGLGVTDAGRLTENRRYREKPLNQYNYQVPEGSQTPPPPENNEDDIGWVTKYTYDWRMRPVEAKNQNAAGLAMTQTLTWMDNLGRTRFTAGYGTQAPSPTSAPHPAVMGPGDPLPTAAAILAANPPPISLSESIYDARGQVQESRQYNVGDTTGTTYTSTFTYYDHQGKTLEVIAPNSPVRRYLYDAKGRQVSSSSWAAGVELSRTETTFDADDRAIISITSERRHDQLTAGPITGSNCVKSYRHSWYDLAGRVIASVDYGTNSAAGIFKTGDEPSRPAAAPVVEDSDHRVIAAKYTDVPPPARLTAYRYDDKGRQVAVFHPDHTTTRYEYDDLGRMTAKFENADAADQNLFQIVRYVFDSFGRVTQMIADRPEGQIDQKTQIDYGAMVISPTNSAAISANNSWIRAVHFPNPETGEPSDTDTLYFTYYSDGSVATRTDSRGIVFRHYYDELGRRIETIIDDSDWFRQPEEGQPDNRPAGRISRITYQYLPGGQLEFVTAYTRERVQEEELERILCQNKFEYDLRQHLTKEWQSHGGPVSGSTPYVSYNWLQSPATEYNFDRLAMIQYPARCEDQQAREVKFDYGDNAGNVDSIAGRFTQISEMLSDVSAEYQYAGISRRISMSYGNGISQSFVKGQEYGGLDLFGRIKELNYVTASATVQAFEYGYDLAGNRTFARATQWPTGTTANPVPHINDRSYLYTYDSLNRLIDARFGALNPTNTAIVQGAGGAGNPPIPQSFTWALDNLGNWTGGESVAGLTRTGDFDGNGTVDTATMTHRVDHANRIFETNDSGLTLAVPNDPTGNTLQVNEKYYLQYDAFNRLIQVNERKGEILDPVTGQITGGQLGSLIARYAYDGLGRLIRKQNPVSDGQTYLQTRDFYYDGSRRIQEVILRPDVDLANHLIGGKENNDLIAKFDVDGDGVPDVEQPDVFIIDDAGMAFLIETGAGQRWTDREYVYGPDDVDEFLAQIDFAMRVTYILQDANLNVMALTAGASLGGPANWGGAGQPPSGGNPGLPATGQVVQQFHYEPYGAAKGVDSFFPYGVNRVGHQGLFFERFDGDYTQENLTAAAAGLYYNRNRWYSPTLGRFVSRDPNETALPIMAALSMNGDSLLLSIGVFGADGMYGDGMNLYQYQGSNPINTRDPLGLFMDDDVDSLIADYYGERAQFANHLYNSFVGGAMKVMRGAAVWAFVAGVTAICPPLGAVMQWELATFGLLHDLNSIIIEGWSWSSGASAALNAVTIGTSTAALTMMSGSTAAMGAAYAGARAEGPVPVGTKVYRVWGGASKRDGHSWTTVDPRTVNYRSGAGLPNRNTGRYLSEGTLMDNTGVRVRTALPLDGNPGGLPELIIPNPKSQVLLDNVSRSNPQF